MSANLDELEKQRQGNEASPEKFDEATKKEVEKFVNRYCFGYQYKAASEAMLELLKQARTHR